jgi:hypothetical protein
MFPEAPPRLSPMASASIFLLTSQAMIYDVHVRDALGKISSMLACDRIQLLGEQAEIVAARQKPAHSPLNNQLASTPA